MKVFIAPSWTGTDTGDGGIRQVVTAMRRYLPDFGIEIVDDPDDADLLNCHAVSVYTRPGKPMVASCHGLHWSEHDWPRSSQHVNLQVRENLMQAEGWTAPSQWVRNAMTRGMAIDPAVIYHGVEIPETIQPSEGYILWNKTRADPVCDPTIVRQLAERLPHRTFVTSFLLGEPMPNVRVTGRLPHAAALDLVAKAGVYLATVQETFGIGTLEAMAAGVPVVGYDHAGQHEIIRNGDTGILVELGNVEALADAIETAFVKRKNFSREARKDAIARWQWPDKVEQYANLFRAVYERYHRPGPKISLLVAYHNLGSYIGDTIQSAISQSMSDWEMVIVDDASEPDQAATVQQLTAQDDRIKLIRSDLNIKPSRARNLAATNAKGKYLMPLDADDMLAPNALALLSDALDKDRSIALAYGHLDLINEDGSNRWRGQWPPEQFDWHKQIRRDNQLPYCPMMRREVLLQTGGYRERERSVEDAGLWIRATSLGFRAKKVTEASTILYRLRQQSWSKVASPEQDWTAWIGWRGGATLPPWGAQGQAPESVFWPVPSYIRPHVSVIIPVGPGHERYLVDALDSVFFSQRYREWECIVVNDTGKSWGGFHEWGSPVQGAAWAKVIDNHGPKGVASARNAGLAVATAPVVLFLDADDFLMPEFLEVTMPVQARTGGIVYTDVLIAKGAGEPLQPGQFEPFTLDGVKEKMQHTNTVLIPRMAFADLPTEGLDESLIGWEDWDLYIGLRMAGWCSTHIPHPAFVYRHHTGQRREQSLSDKAQVEEQFKRKWAKLYSGEVDLMACGCREGNQGAFQPAAVAAMGMVAQQANYDSQIFTLVQYIGDEQATRTWIGPMTGKRYRFGKLDGRTMVPVDNRDVDRFRNNREFAVRG